MYIYRVCSKQLTPTCKGSVFPYHEYKDQKYCKWCAFAGHKSKMKTGQCEGYGTKKYLERIVKDENGKRLATSNQYYCRKCGKITLGDLVGHRAEVLTLGRA